MTNEELKLLEREVNKLKFKAGQQASELHDLVEDRLLSDWEDLIPVAQKTYEACKAWSEKQEELKNLKN